MPHIKITKTVITFCKQLVENKLKKHSINTLWPETRNTNHFLYTHNTQWKLWGIEPIFNADYKKHYTNDNLAKTAIYEQKCIQHKDLMYIPIEMDNKLFLVWWIEQ